LMGRRNLWGGTDLRSKNNKRTQVAGFWRKLQNEKKATKRLKRQPRSGDKKIGMVKAAMRDERWTPKLGQGYRSRKLEDLRRASAVVILVKALPAGA